MLPIFVTAPVRVSMVKIMPVYVAAIASRSIAAFHADNGSDAALRVRDRSFRDDLMVLTTGGRPLWDGMADLGVREALAGEAVKWRTSRARAVRQGNIEDEDDGWVAFLVPLNDPGRKPRRLAHDSEKLTDFWDKIVR